MRLHGAVALIGAVDARSRRPAEMVGFVGRHAVLIWMTSCCQTSKGGG